MAPDTLPSSAACPLKITQTNTLTSHPAPTQMTRPIMGLRRELARLPAHLTELVLLREAAGAEFYGLTASLIF
jgi:hypothetical protein